MASKIKLFSLECKDAEANFIGPIDTVEAKRYGSLYLWLEEFGVILINFWNIEAKCRMKGKLEGMTLADPKVYVIPSLTEDGGPYKHQCLTNIFVVIDSLDPIQSFDLEMLGFADLPSDDEPLVEWYDSSRGSAIAFEKQE
jgi:hypothetical protein